MKIKRTSDNLSKSDGVTAGGGRKAPDAGASVFAESIARAERQIHRKELNELIEDILAQGKKLAARADLKEFKKYRSMISQFLEQVVEGSHKFAKHSLLDRMGRHRIYGIVRKINTELEELAAEIVKSEKNNILILEKLDIIKGLLLDIEL